MLAAVRCYGAVHGGYMPRSGSVTEPWALFCRSVLGSGPLASLLLLTLFTFVSQDRLSFPDEIRQRM